MKGFTYDSGALIAAERNRKAMWSFHRSALRTGVVCTVPSVVVAQVWRSGARQANVGRLLAGCVVEALDYGLARRAGELLARTGGSDIVDAVVVVAAVGRGDVIVTADPKDIRRLADAAGAKPLIVAI